MQRFYVAAPGTGAYSRPCQPFAAPHHARSSQLAGAWMRTARTHSNPLVQPRAQLHHRRTAVTTAAAAAAIVGCPSVAPCCRPLGLSSIASSNVYSGTAVGKRRCRRQAAMPPLAMINVDFASPSLVLGITLIGCGIALLQVGGQTAAAIAATIKSVPTHGSAFARINSDSCLLRPAGLQQATEHPGRMLYMACASAPQELMHIVPPCAWASQQSCIKYAAAGAGCMSITRQLPVRHLAGVGYAVCEYWQLTLPVWHVHLASVYPLRAMLCCCTLHATMLHQAAYGCLHA